MRRNKCEISTREQIGRKSSELWLGKHTVRVKFHETVQFLSSETDMKIE
jgi:hypothetical protein